MRKPHPVVLVLLLALFPTWVMGQEKGISREKQEKELAKKENDEAKAQAKAEKELLKRHVSLQDKETRKRMRKHGKRAETHGSRPHRDPFFTRLLRRKH
jgi:hypothetical protein